ncbi:MAG: hypothetical protein ABI900_14250 [Betaproteobacteria bacterium]
MNTRILFLSAWIGLVSSAAFAAESDTLKIKCGEMGTKFAAQFKKEYTSEISIWGNPEFHYSTGMNTCLVYTEVIDGALDKQINAIWSYRRVTDIYSNKVLTYSRYFVRKDDPTQKEGLVNLGNVGAAVNISPAEFARAKMELFNR